MKVFLVLPAYNASKTLVSFFEKISHRSFHTIILVDDNSQDDTVSIAKKLAKRHPSLLVHRTLRNLGYGGNLKFCLSEALKMGADVIVELHPDGEYLLDGIAPALLEIKNGARLVLGNRFTKHTDPRQAGMFWWKYPVLRLLTFLHNLVLRTKIPDLHQGFRVYTKEMLQVCDYRKCSNSFLFSFQIIAQSVFRRQTVSSVPVGTRYTGKKRGATLGHSLRYSFGTFIVLGQFFLARRGVKMALFMKPSASPPPCILCDTNYFVTKKTAKKRITYSTVISV
jgi:glycosyltransferase involved in cell wall biosynthesis